MRLLKMACSRRKKTILYSLCLGALVYMGVQVVYFSETFTPLMMLSDAQSEARRLLKFISFYHYQCNSTLPLYNRTDWPLCVDKKYGVDIEDKRPKIAYSIGPAWDFTFERNLVYNLSYNLFMFSLVDVPRDLKEINRTHSYKTMIVANDPADYGRNSYGTQTLNSVMEAFHHRRVDILKIDLLADRSHAYELLYYMAEDHIMPRFQQLHVTVHIDKLDDDYLYRWYRAFYNLFYHEGFRLYHTSASDPLCLQVTMMESCIYYTSWIHDPGPNVFVMHPPAIDGSLEFEEQRLMDYLETEQTSCDHLKLLPGATGAKSSASWEGMAVCADKNTEGTCVAVIMSEKTTVSQLMFLGRKCEVISLVPATTMYTEPHVVMTLPRKRHMLGRLPRKKELTLREAMMVLHGLEQIDWLYMELPESASYFLTAVLDSGILHMVQQLGLVLVTSRDRLAVNVRRTFSELKRLQSQHMQIFHAAPFSDAQLRYIPSSQLHSYCCHRISLQKKWKISRR